MGGWKTLKKNTKKGDMEMRTPLRSPESTARDSMKGSAIIISRGERGCLSTLRSRGRHHRSWSDEVIEADRRVVRQAIAEAKGSMALNLTNKGIVHLPAECEALMPGLKRLNLGQNRIRSIPRKMMRAAVYLQSVRLDSNGLEEIPISLFQVSRLQVLEAHKNKIERLPDSIGNMQCLTRILDLHRNQLVQLPETIANLVSLQELNVAWNWLSDEGIIPVVRLRSLTLLDISHNRLLRLPPDLALLRNLKTLSAECNEVTAVDGGCVLPQLVKLNLSANKLESIAVDLRLTGLQKLHIRRNSLRDFPLAALSEGFPALTELDAGWNFLESVDWLPHLTRLKTLDLTHNRLRELPSAEHDDDGVTLARDNLADSFHGSCAIGSNSEYGSFGTIGSLEELSRLLVHHNYLSSLPAAVACLGSLSHIDASFNAIRFLPTSLTLHNLKLLSILNLSNNKIESIQDNFFGELNDLPRLTFLDLSHNRLKRIPEAVFGITSLQTLHVQKNRLGSLPDEVNLPMLKELNVSSNNLSTLPVSLSACTSLSVLRAGFNRLREINMNITWIDGLAELWLCSNEIKTLPSLSTCSALKVLSLAQNRLERLPFPLDQPPPSLRRLDLFGNELLFTDSIDTLVNLVASLTEWDLAGNYGITDSALVRKTYCVQQSKSVRYYVGLADTVGMRHEMQDVMLVCGQFRKSSKEDLFGIFDGHGITSGAARFAANAMGQELIAHLRRAELVEAADLSTADDPAACLRKTFTRVHNLLRLTDVDKNSGTTALVALVIERTLYVANLGDSRCVLCRNRRALRLTKDHKAVDPTEEVHIKARGGLVTADGRVVSELAISRAIGDYHLHPLITAEPEVSVFELQLNDDFLVLACDGLWDVIGDQEVVDLVRMSRAEYLSKDRKLEKSRWPDYAAVSLRNVASVYGSKDNISVMVIGLGDVA